MASAGDKILPFAGGDPMLFYFKDGAVMTFKTNGSLSLRMTESDDSLSCIATGVGDQEEYEFIVHVVKSGQIALQSRKYPSKWFPKEAADNLKSDLELRYPNQDLSNKIAITRKGTYQPFTSSLVELQQASDPQAGPVKNIYLKKDGKYLTAQSSGKVTEEARASESAKFTPLIVDERHELIVAADSFSGHIFANGNRVTLMSNASKQLVRMGNKASGFRIDGNGSDDQNPNALFEAQVRPPATAVGAPDGKVCLRNVFAGDEVNDQGQGGWLRMNKKTADGTADGQKKTALRIVQMEPDYAPGERVKKIKLDRGTDIPATDPDRTPYTSTIVLESVKQSASAGGAGGASGSREVVALSVGATGSAGSAVGQQDAITRANSNKFTPTAKTLQHKEYTRAGDTVNLRTLIHGNVISLKSRVTGQALRMPAQSGILSADGDEKNEDAQFIVSVRRPKGQSTVVALQSVKYSDQWIKLFEGKGAQGEHVEIGGGGFECNFHATDQGGYLLFQSVHEEHTDYLGIESMASKKAVAIPASNPSDQRAHFSPHVIQSSPYLRFTAGSSEPMLTFEEGRTVILRSLNCRGRTNTRDERNLRVHPPAKASERFPPRIECQGGAGSESRFLVRVTAPGVVALKSEHISEVVDASERGHWWIDLHKTEPINDRPLEIDGIIEIYRLKDRREPNIRDNYTYLRGDGGSLSNLKVDTYEAKSAGKSNTYVRLIAQRTPERKLGAIYREPFRSDPEDTNEVFCDPVVVTKASIDSAELWTPVDSLFQMVHKYEFN